MKFDGKVHEADSDHDFLLRCPQNSYMKVKYPASYVTLNLRAKILYRCKTESGMNERLPKAENRDERESGEGRENLGIRVKDLRQSPRVPTLRGEEHLPSAETKTDQQKGPKESMVFPKLLEPCGQLGPTQPRQEALSRLHSVLLDSQM